MRRRSARAFTALLTITLVVGAGADDLAQAALPEYRRTDYAIRIPDRALWPYAGNGAGPLQGTNTFDAEGVSVRVISGVEYDHPVLQAQYMLTRLSSYGFNHDPAYLSSVRAHGDRLIANATHSRDALYLPYPFDWALHGDKADMMAAPWYSAMAQGQALSAFVRLFEATGEQKYRDAADGLFASFMNAKDTGGPWTVAVDEDGLLWFEEYAKDPGADGAFNGHVFAIYGLWDYYRLTGSAEAKALFQGGVTAVVAHLPDVRNPGWISRYCLAHPEYMYANYHTVHVGQLYQLYNLTGAAALAVAADQFLEDYPAAQHAGRGYVGTGAHVVHALDAVGRVVDTRTITVATAEAVTVGSRQGIAGEPGVWLRVDSGSLAGFWVRETADRAFVKLSREVYTFDKVRLIRFKRGTYSGFTFNALGLRATTKTFTLTADSAAHVRSRMVMNGVTYFEVVDGVWAGRWIPAQAGASLL